MADQVSKYVFLLFSVCLWVHTCHSSTPTGDTLKPGDILDESDDTTRLCSASNIFCMYFTKIYEYDDSDFTYLKISSTQTGTIWIGNRNEPVVNNSGVLTLDHSGELKIISQGKPIKVLYSPIRPINNTVAKLLDNGNFVLQELHPNGSTKSVLWQSFDYPTNKLLAGMKLGVNHKTGHNWSLVSWIAYYDPSAGDFTLEWEPRNRELVIRVRGPVYWKSGSLRNNKTFQNIPEKIQSFYHFTIISDEEEDSFTFTPRNKSNDEISYWVLDDDGKLNDGETLEEIARADKCYGFNDDSGCQKLKNISRACRSRVVKNVESVYGYINFTDNRNLEFVKNDTNSTLTKVDCLQRCWSNCECVGVYNIYANDTGCTFLYRNALEVINHVLHSDIHWNEIYVLNGPLHHQGKKRWIWRSVVIATSLFIICLLILCLALRKRKITIEERRRKGTQAIMLDLQTSNESMSANYLQEETNKGLDLRIFSYESIMEATNHFSSENKLGQGGFGPVYKGMLPTGKEVAIKRLSKTSRQGVVEFKNELSLICELRHINLVQLLGCCIHKEERMLIYEYMPNKSLDFFLFDSTRGKMLDWKKRFNIIEGIAQGLLYLHKYSRLKIIHRDLKAGNILLDENMNPKISDFGMARIFTQQDSEVNTKRIVGTFGYMSPEYAMNGVFSTKSDVYSFGVLLLEIVSGRRNNSFYNANCNGPLNLVGYAWDL